MPKIKINPSSNNFDSKFLNYSQMFSGLNESLEPFKLEIKSLLETGIVNDFSSRLFTNDDTNFSLNMALSLFRDDYINNYGFYLVNDKFINITDKLFRNNKILEVGAGTGFLSKLLQDVGLDVTPTDKSIENNQYGFSKKHTDIIEVDSIKHLKDNNSKYDMVIMSWPDYSSSFANNILKNMTQGQILMYIGEGYGGCTANDDFYDKLENCASLLEKETSLYKPANLAWFGIHDRVKLYKIL